MTFSDMLHSGYVHPRRVRVLSGHLARQLPRKARVLDVGCGDGLLARWMQKTRPDIEIEGIDIMVRNQTHFPVARFDGNTIPYGDASFDVVMFVDVLHHMEDPMRILREGARVARKAIFIKDHLRNGFLAGPTLRFMDRVGNVRHGVELPYHYWSKQKWLEVCRALNLRVDLWTTDIGLYPWPASWVFGRSLHFIAQLAPAGAVPLKGPDLERKDAEEAWERAYLRFETPQQEIRKFTRRLRRVGMTEQPRHAKVVELFCGRGNGLHALSRLGFISLEGVDRSDSLLKQYQGPAKLYVCDARQLPFEDRSRDIVIVQGGLHHLQDFPNDVEQALSEANRVLREEGLFINVEPWPTFFLSFVHAICKTSLARLLSKKIGALATMIRYEEQTYRQWLSHPQEILGLFEKYFRTERRWRGMTKLMFVGSKKRRPAG